MFIKKSIYVLAMGVCLLAACKKSKSINVEEKLISDEKARNPTCMCGPYINKFEYKGRIVYLRYFNGPLCNGVPSYYNSSGERISFSSRVTLDVFLAEATLIEEIYSCKEAK